MYYIIDHKPPSSHLTLYLSLDQASSNLLLDRIYQDYICHKPKINKALFHVRKALEPDPDDWNIIDSLAWVYFKQNKYQEALAEINRSLELSKDEAEVLDHAGDIHLKLGENDLALDYYNEALKYADKDLKEKVLQKISSLDK